MKYMETGSTNPYYNLAFEEYVLRNFTDNDYLMLWQNDNTIVYGLHQNPLEEIDINKAERAGAKLVRRMTGGGTVYHDMGNLNFSYVTDWNDGKDVNYARFLEPIVRALKKYGLDINVQGRNDLVLDGKKISGSAQTLEKERLLHHGTLLINTDLSVLGELLIVPTEKIKSKGIRSVRSRVTNIQDYVEEKLEIAEVKNLLKESWAEYGDFQEIFPTEEDLKKIRKLEEEKYKTEAWNFDRSPKYNFRNRVKYDGGIVEVFLNIADGIIDECSIKGDFLSLQSVKPLEDAIKGHKHNKDSLIHIFDEQPLELYFGNISKAELFDVFFV